MRIVYKIIFSFIALSVFVMGQSDHSLKFPETNHSNRGIKTDLMNSFQKSRPGFDDAVQGNEWNEFTFSRNDQDKSNSSSSKYVMLSLEGSEFRYSFSYC